MNKRLLAILKESKNHQRTRHFFGIPPELTDGKDVRIPLPWPKFVIIEETNEGVYLSRYSINGEEAGDTWHKNIEEAFYQAEQEYGGLLGEWEELPPNIDNVLEYAMNKIKN